MKKKKERDLSVVNNFAGRAEAGTERLRLITGRGAVRRRPCDNGPTDSLS